MSMLNKPQRASFQLALPNGIRQTIRNVPVELFYIVLMREEGDIL